MARLYWHRSGAEWHGFFTFALIYSIHGPDWHGRPRNGVHRCGMAWRNRDGHGEARVFIHTALIYSFTDGLGGTGNG
jgi:hypothetical protein